jgi:hypothetical protein
MMNRSTGIPKTIILVGNDERLVYLLQRFIEQSPCVLIPWLTIPSAEEIKRIHPSVIIFSTIELLEAAQPLMDHTSAHEIPVMVCTSVAGEAHARELGADACLFHPLTFDHFNTVLAGICPVESNVSGL